MRKTFLIAALALLSGCASRTTFVHTDTTLGRVVVYRNGVAYFERTAHVDGDTLHLSVPADKIDDFLKSLTVVDARTGEPAPIAYDPGTSTANDTGLIDMKIHLPGPSPHEIKLTYVTEAPSWKPSYRVVVEPNGKVKVQAWAIVDNTSGEDWQKVKLGVGASSAMSFRFDLKSVRVVERETLAAQDMFVQAPPVGGATYGNQQAGVNVITRRVFAEMGEESLKKDEATRSAQATASPPPPPRKEKAHDPKVAAKPAPSDAVGRMFESGGAGLGTGASIGHGRGASASPPAQPQSQLANVARALQGNKNTIVVEGFADERDGDKNAASLDRANRAREQLVQNGVPAERVVAVGRGEQAGKHAGVRIVEGPPANEVKPTSDDGKSAVAAGTEGPPPSTDPIGTSHFESDSPIDVPRGTSAMVSILHSEAEGEVVYLYDPESARGNAAFPFRSVRIKNPTDSALESGPVTVFGEGKFIGEGLAEPIPARSAAFVPFALDRQIVVEKKEADRDEIDRILTVQRGVLSTEVRHTRKTTLTLHNRLAEKATVYIRHTVPQGFKVTRGPASPERIGDAHLFRVDVDASGKAEVIIEEATPIFRTTDIRTPAGLEMIRAWISASAAEGPLKRELSELLRLNTDMANLDQQIATLREQMGEYRRRQDELHVQIVTLRAVKTNGGPLLTTLEKKLGEVSERLSKATIDLVGLEEKLMVARVRFQDGVADLSLQKKD